MVETGVPGVTSLPARFYFSPWIHAQPFLPWVLIGLLLCGIKANRQPAAWSVWAALGMSAAMAGMFGGVEDHHAVAQGAALGSAGILLLPGLCACRVRGARLAGMMGVLGVFVWLSVYAAVNAQAQQTDLLAWGALVPALEIWLGLRVWRSVWRPAPPRTRLALGIAGLTLAGWLAVTLVDQGALLAGLGFWMAGPVTGLTLLFMMAPMLALWVAVPFYRARLQALAGLDTPPSATAGRDASAPRPSR